MLLPKSSIALILAGLLHLSLALPHMPKLTAKHPDPGVAPVADQFGGGGGGSGADW